MPCFSHTLQLAVHVAMKLPAVSRAIACCNHFHHSVQSTQILRSKQKSFNHPQHSLIQEVSTRWNSSYYMMERIVLQQQLICAALLEIKRGYLLPDKWSEICFNGVFYKDTKTIGGNNRNKWRAKSGHQFQLYVCGCTTQFST